LHDHVFLPRERNVKEAIMAVVLTDRSEFEVAATDGLCVSPGDAEAITGWTLKPEGMCRDELCVPLGDEARRGGKVDIAAFWRTLGHPIVSDTSGEVWVLGTAADSRMASLTGLGAPDFALPDLSGLEHRLSGLRGKKVFLTTWASW
jgi:hypothetical protein